MRLMEKVTLVINDIHELIMLISDMPENTLLQVEFEGEEDDDGKGT